MDTMIKKIVANENFYRRMLMELGDVMQHVVNDDLEVEGVTESTLRTIAEVRSYIHEELHVVESLKSGENSKI